jgi:DNA-binding Xre family transcriptional regulator
MSQEKALLQALKRQLKLRDLTYVDVASHLALSEASVKRLFSEGNISVSRLESVCTLLAITLTDLVLIAQLDQTQITSLTFEQEQNMVSDETLLLVSVCVIDGYSFNDIVTQYDVTDTELIQYLAHLDRLKIIELQPQNRIKLLISPNFNWLVNGPIQRFFQQHIKEDFFKSDFKQTTEKLLVINGLLSDGSNSELQHEMQQLINQFAQLKNSDQRITMNNKHGTTLVVAMRQWNAALFENKTRN